MKARVEVLVSVIGALATSACLTPQRLPRAVPHTEAQFAKLVLDGYGLSAAAAACTENDDAWYYLSYQLPTHFAESWERLGETSRAVANESFRVDMDFALNLKSEVLYAKVLYADPPQAGDVIRAVFVQASPFPPIPEAAACIGGQPFRLHFNQAYPIPKPAWLR